MLTNDCTFTHVKGNNQDLDVTTENLRKWISLDTVATSHLGCNDEMCHNVESTDSKAGVSTTSSALDVKHTAVHSDDEE